MNRLKNLLFVICLSVVLSLTQTQSCYADSNMKDNLGWAGLAAVGIGATVLFSFLSKSNADSGDGNLYPVIHSSSTHNLLSINGDTAQGEIVVQNAGSRTVASFNVKNSVSPIKILSNSTCLTQSTAPGAYCKFNIEYTGNGLKSDTSVPFEVLGAGSDTIYVNAASRPIDTFYVPSVLATHASGIDGRTYDIAKSSTNGIEFVYVATSDGVYKTNDNGAHWIPIKEGLTLATGEVVNRLTTSPSGVVFASTSVFPLAAGPSHVGKVYQLNGAKWIQIGTFPAPNGDIYSLCYHNGVLYVGVDDKKVYSFNVSIWAEVTTGWPLGQRPTSLYSSPDGFLYAGTLGSGVYKLDASNAWVSVGTGLAAQVNAIYYFNNNLYAGAVDNKVYYYDAATNSWLDSRTSGASIASPVYSLYSNNGALYAGTRDKGVFKYDEDNESWAATAPSGNLLATGSVYALNSSGGILYAAFYSLGIYSTTGVAATASDTPWIEANNDEVEGKDNYFLCYHDGYIYIGTNGNGIFRSNDGGANWTSFNTGLTDKAVTALHSSKDNTTPTSAYLYAGTATGNSFRVDTKAIPLTWSGPVTVSSGKRINNFMSDTSGTLYVGSDYGVHRSTDNGLSFASIGPGSMFATTRAFDLLLSSVTGELYVGFNDAATSYNGVYKLANPHTTSSPWVPVLTGLSSSAQKDIYALTEHNGSIYCGNVVGEVYKLVGTTWTLVGAGAIAAKPVWTLESLGQYLYAGLRDASGVGAGVWRSTGAVGAPDGDWRPITGDLDASAAANTFYSDGTNLYVGTTAEVYKGLMTK